MIAYLAVGWGVVRLIFAAVALWRSVGNRSLKPYTSGDRRPGTCQGIAQRREGRGGHEPMSAGSHLQLSLGARP